MRLQGDAGEKLLRLYQAELEYLQTLGSDFAKAHPDIAPRLAWEPLQAGDADPHVERLRESFAFLAARIQQQLQAGFPQLSQHLLEVIMPGASSPMPSMIIVRMEPDRNDGALNAGVTIERGTNLRARLAQGQQAACEFRTGHTTTLWPIEVSEASYHGLSGSVAGTPLPSLAEVTTNRARSALRIRLRTTNGARFDQLSLDRIQFHLTTEAGGEGRAFQLLELIAGSSLGVIPVSMPPAQGRGESKAHPMLGRDRLRHMGFAEDEALLAVANRASDAHRILQEYSRFRERFLFFELRDLRQTVQATSSTELELWILLSRADPTMTGRVTREAFALNCTTAVNLVPRRSDRFPIGDHQHEFHLVVDRTRPNDFEVAQVISVTGYGDGATKPQTFWPMYGLRPSERAGAGRYFSVRRLPRLLSTREQTNGPRHPNYVGTEVFVSIVDQAQPPFDPELRHLSAEVLCTNRDLPYRLPRPLQGTHFTIANGPSVATIRVIAGPSDPGTPMVEGESAWKLISLVSQRHLDRLGEDGRAGAEFLREILKLHWASDDERLAHHQEGLASVVAVPTSRRVVDRGAMSWVRGHEVTMTLADGAFAGGSGYLLAAVFEHWLADQCAINSFVQTAVRTQQGDELGRWPARSGGVLLT